MLIPDAYSEDDVVIDTEDVVGFVVSELMYVDDCGKISAERKCQFVLIICVHYCWLTKIHHDIYIMNIIPIDDLNEEFFVVLCAEDEADLVAGFDIGAE